MGRLIGILLSIGVVVWLVKSYGLIGGKAAPDAAASAVDKAKDAARQGDSYNSQLATAAQEASTAGSNGEVTENMTPEQVRALLGPPDNVEQTTSDAGKPQERWTYSKVGKTVLFENGVAVSIQ